MASLTDRERLTRALAALAVARGSEADEFALEVYKEALSDLDVSLLERACFDLAKAPRAEFESSLPPVATVRQQASTIKRLDLEKDKQAKLLPLPKADEDGPRYFCLDCFDEPSGWRIYQCPASHCGRRTVHVPHSYADHCHCWQRNPVVAEWNRRHGHQRIATK